MANSKGLKFLVTGALLVGSATGCGSQEEEPFLNVRGEEEEGEVPPVEPPNINVFLDEELLDDGSEGPAVEVEAEGESDPTVVDPSVTDPSVMDPSVTDPSVTDPSVMDPSVMDPTAMEQARPPVRNAVTMQDRPFLNVRGPGNDNSPR